MNNELEAIVEISMGSKYKFEVHKLSGQLFLDRPLNQSIPSNYGFIPGTIATDDDPTDAFIIALEPLPPLASISVVVLGAFRCTDNGFQDDKLICMVKGDQISDDYLNMETKRIHKYLETYKEGFVIQKYVDKVEALGIVAADLVRLNFIL